MKRESQIRRGLTAISNMVSNRKVKVIDGKSIFAKLSQVDDLTGEINDDYGKTLKRLADMGIAIEGQNGSLLDATEILENIGEKWDTFSEQQQKYIASGLGVNWLPSL